ncbi:pyocin activator PrtN family protein [Aurantimonas coralicida]|uniref:pyocin activator PrtN family protein n=1 Tax=Aurantimonas coralicida TaxID=182270 RepID=UPI002E7ACC4C|nr:pyocin activator PrtN family protein [Aurantimonas coralicida]MCD1644943.1 pyocin activator PrtN family protein [Aurantimonas coralicida]
MNTAMLLMAQYDGQAVIPINAVCRDYFSHLTPDKLARKIGRGEIRLPLIRIEDSQRAAKGVHISHLSAWIDARVTKAEKRERSSPISRSCRLGTTSDFPKIGPKIRSIAKRPAARSQ